MSRDLPHTLTCFSSLCFTLGIFSIGLLSELPTLYWSFLGLVLTLAIYYCLRYKALAWLLAGLCYGSFWGHYTLAHQLPEALSTSEFMVKGEVVGLPLMDGNRIRFHLKLLSISNNSSVLSADRASITNTALSKMKVLRLNWYYPTSAVHPGEVWQLKVKLRRPRGTVNPGGFDYQVWLIRQGISATGYVRKGSFNQLISKNLSFDVFRFNLKEAIDKAVISADSKSLIMALTLGDQSNISHDLWRMLGLSGVVHLLVISGLHVGLVAYFFFGAGALLARLIALFGVAVTARYWGSCFALVAAVIYASLAGFSLPTQRALVMITITILMLLLDRKATRGAIFSVTLAIVAITDPLAFLSPGFWLSFGAVACLLWLLPVSAKKLSMGHKFVQLFMVQWRIFLVLLVPLAFFQLPIAWLSPLVNMVAIPWVSFVMVPLCLIAILLFPLSVQWAEQVWLFTGTQLDYFIRFVEAMFEFQTLMPLSGIPEATWRYFPIITYPVLGSLLGLVCVLLLIPSKLSGKYLAVPLLVAVVATHIPSVKKLLTPTNSSFLKITVLDVGQGLSVVVMVEGEEGRYTLVYDTGPSYGSFSMADAVVIPYLRREGVINLDMLVISHSDNDHAGGASQLIDAFQPLQIMAGEPLSGFGDFDSTSSKQTIRHCNASLSWHWNSVDFQFIYPSQLPPAQLTRIRSNNRSCVLQIRYRDQTIILPGDIEQEVERQLQKLDITGPTTVLIAPHHGSKTSSTAGFITMLSPSYVVFSTGYKHHFGHPATAVVARYQRINTQLLNTAEDGAIEFEWSENAELSINKSRLKYRRYWH